VAVPERRPRVEEMPPFAWGLAWLSSPGPLEVAGREFRFYVDPVDRSWNHKKRDEHLRALNRPQLAVTVLHEVIPGHALQIEAAARAPTSMQKLARSYVFAEGWAHYAEQMMLDEGSGSGDAKVRLAQAREALLRACRLVAALRIHGFGLKVEDAAKIFSDWGYLDDYASHREAERAAVDPLVLAPTLGKLAISKLRDDYQSLRGDAFTLRDFHDRLLAHGALPISVLRRLLLPDGGGALL
jgi:uncharacterized protein (DUF885 family)